MDPLLCKTLSHRLFSFIKVLTGAVPFRGERSTAAAFAIMDGRRPPRPTHPIFSEELWSLVKRCWDHDPRWRPEVVEVLDTLLNLSAFVQPRSIHNLTLLLLLAQQHPNRGGVDHSSPRSRGSHP